MVDDVDRGDLQRVATAPEFPSNLGVQAPRARDVLRRVRVNAPEAPVTDRRRPPERALPLARPDPEDRVSELVAVELRSDDARHVVALDESEVRPAAPEARVAEDHPVKDLPILDRLAVTGVGGQAARETFAELPRRAPDGDPGGVTVLGGRYEDEAGVADALAASPEPIDP